jgi:hypothetical protein
MEDSDWDIVLEEMRNKAYPLRELKIDLILIHDKPIGPGFIELVKTIGDHTTLIKLDCDFYYNSEDPKMAVLLNELKNHHFIKHLELDCSYFDLNTARRFA